MESNDCMLLRFSSFNSRYGWLPLRELEITIVEGLSVIFAKIYQMRLTGG